MNNDECAQLITFSIGGQRYAVDILEVQEVRSLSEGAVTAGPHSGCAAFMAEQAESTESSASETTGKAGQCDQAPGSAESRNTSALAAVKDKITAI